MPKIMLIDDDESMHILLAQIAAREGWTFCGATDGETGLPLLRAERPDYLILDVMLPGTNGFDICEKIRAEGRRVPIMFLSAKGDIVDKSIGFKAGADDYLVKPFQNEELVLRVNARLRRKASKDKDADQDSQPHKTRADSYRVGDLEIFFNRYEVTLKGELVALSSREFELIALLASDPGSVFTRGEIMQSLWDDVEAADPNTITVLIRRIREKIEDDPSKPRYLMTIWRVGYKLADKV